MASNIDSNLEAVQKELDGYLYNWPIKVRFAGFESDTLKLAKSGWSLAVRQFREYAYDKLTLQLALKFDDGGLNNIYMLSNTIQLDMFSLTRSAGGMMRHIITLIESYGFEMYGINNAIKLAIMPMMGNISIGDFTAISGIPEQRTELDLRDIRWFKPLNPSVKDILIIEEDIPLLMSMILDTQKNKQDEIKNRQKQRQNMKDYRQMENGIYMKPSEEVKLQLVGVA